MAKQSVQAMFNKLIADHPELLGDATTAKPEAVETTAFSDKAVQTGWAIYKAAYRIFKEVLKAKPEENERKALASMRHALRFKRGYPNQVANIKGVEAFLGSMLDHEDFGAASAVIFAEETAKSKTKAAEVKAGGRKKATPKAARPSLF